MRAARLATLALLFCQVGQETISIFILFSNLLGGSLDGSRYCPGMVLSMNSAKSDFIFFSPDIGRYTM
jgi:hypothetical protein